MEAVSCNVLPIMIHNNNKNGGQSMERLIYIADDEYNIRELIRYFLEKEGYQTKVFADGLSLLEAFGQETPDLVILDVMMPGIDGFEVCKKIRLLSNVPIIIVSAKDHPLERVAGIALGSDDYLIKPFLPKELAVRIEALFRRIDITNGIIADPSIKSLVFGDLHLVPNTRTATVNNQPLTVTPTEFDFLAYLLQAPGKTAAKADLLRNVWKTVSDGVETRVTDDLVKRLRKKLAANDSRVSIKTIWGYGFRLIEEGGAPPQ